MAANKGFSRCRSCKACIKAKRRCEPRNSKCVRCSSKDLTCVYHNEPLVGHGDTIDSPENDKLMTLKAIPERKEAALDQKLVAPRSMFSPILQSLVAQGLVSQPQSLESFDGGLTYEPVLPEIYWRSDVATIRCVVGHLKSFSALFAREACTPFIHRQLYDRSLPKQMQDVFTACGSYASAASINKDMMFRIVQLKFDELTENYPISQSFEGILASIQALILYLIICLFDGDARQRKFAEPHVRTLNQWSRQLWEQVPSQMPETLSPWEAWVFGESVRRTIIISHMVQSVYWTIKVGYHVHTLFVEALPFELHTLLWDAQSAAAWDSLTTSSRPSMVSYREYVESFAGGQVNPPSSFEKLLLLACCGKSTFEATLQGVRFLSSQ